MLLQKDNMRTTAMNAANEIAVQAFLDGYIKFTDIAKLIKHRLNKCHLQPFQALMMY